MLAREMLDILCILVRIGEINDVLANQTVKSFHPRLEDMKKCLTNKVIIAHFLYEESLKKRARLGLF